MVGILILRLESVVVIRKMIKGEILILWLKMIIESKEDYITSILFNDSEDHNLDCHLHGESVDSDYISHGGIVGVMFPITIMFEMI